MTIESPSLPDDFFTQKSLFTQDLILNGGVSESLSKGDTSSSLDLLLLPDTSNPTAIEKEAKLFDGSTIKLRLKETKPKVDHLSLSSSDSLDLIDIDKLFEKVELKRAIKSSNNVLRETTPPSRDIGNGSGLWTDKYRPRGFMELCSAGNDKQYRLMLHWLRKWSSLVFKEDMDIENNDSVDHLGRPLKKILLVNGPVGIGKTIVTHLLATQQGYAVQELNAANSMDPSLGSGGTVAGGSVHSALKMKIINALTSNSITSGGRPSCLVIDEIDSAINSGDIVRVLNDLIFQDSRSQYSSSSSSSSMSASGKKPKKPFQLNRPIICIANDIYASSGNNSTGSSSSSHFSIDKLRPHCEIITFRKPVTSTRSGGNGLRTIKDYLLGISKREKLGLSYRDISEVVEVCEGDIRSCINYLQFNKRQGGDIELVSDLVGEAEQDLGSLALKDAQLSWFAIVNLLFKRDQNFSKDEGFQNLLNFLSNGGGKSLSSSSNIIDKIMKGCFNSYLDSVATQDDSAVKPSQISDWFWYYDQMERLQMSSGSLLEQYSPIMYLKMWSMFSEINSNRHDRKSTSLVPSGLDFETYETSKQNKFLMKRLIENLPISTRISIGEGIESSITLPGIFIPYLGKILTPIHNANNKTLQHEKIAELVKTFSFQLENHKDLETGEVKLQLSPELDSITNFQSELATQSIDALTKITQLKRQWLFPLIKKELDHIESQKKRKVVTLDSRKEARSAASTVTDPDKSSKRSKLTNSADFFKQRYDNLNEMTSDDKNGSQTQNHEVSRIWVKYHEGFSNAVRKNIGWEDLWLPSHKLEI